jgi:RNA polymerase sigma-70 factor (ECF subfamily)
LLGSTTDAELLVAVKAGERDALGVLYERHASWLLLRLARRCGDAGLVDEALQDTFVAVWRKPDGYRGTGDVAAWMWGIAVRRLLDAIRRADRPMMAPALVPTAESAEDRALCGVDHGEIAVALRGLSPELLAVVQATVLDGLTTRETGRLLGIPSGTVKSRMSRARSQLREGLA